MHNACVKNKKTTVIMHGSILPVTTPPGQPPGQVQPFGPGVGNCLKRFCPGGRGRGKPKTTSRFSCEARHQLITSHLTQWRRTA